MSQSVASAPASYRWVMLALEAGLVFQVGFQLQSVAATASWLTLDRTLGGADIGWLTGLYLMPGVFVALPASSWLGRLGDRRFTVLGASVLMLGALMSAFADDLSQLAWGRIVGGIGATVVTVHRAKVLSDWFEGRETATAQSLAAVSFALGASAAVTILPHVSAAASGRASLYVVVAVGAVVLASTAGLFRDAAPSVARPARQSRASIGGNVIAASTLAGLGFSMLAGGYVCFLAFVPLLLVEQGMSATAAAASVGFASIVSALSVPIGGLLLDRSTRPDRIATTSALATAATHFLLLSALPVWFVVLLFGTLRAGATGRLLSIPGQVARAEHRAVAYGIFFTIYYVGFGLLPPAIGLVFEGSSGPFLTVASLALVWLIAAASVMATVPLRLRAPQHG